MDLDPIFVHGAALKTDLALIVDLYQKTFLDVIGNATTLWFSELGWNDDELLICMQVDGVGVAYDLHGDYQFQFSTGRAVREQGVSH